MADDKKLIVGIDLSREYIQASYLLDGMAEAESVILGIKSQTYHIPTVGYKKIGENKWAFGDTGRTYFESGEYMEVNGIIEKVIAGEQIEADDECYVPEDVLECLLRFVVRECVRVTDVENVVKIAVCVEQFSRKLLDSLSKVLERMDFDESSRVLFNRTESFIYYALNTKEELYQRGVGIFDFGSRRLNYSYMNYATVDGKTIVMVDTERMKVVAEHPREVDAELAKLAQGVMGNAQMSAIYLTGSGFDRYEHLDEFVRIACNRKRAFIGQNLYSKGAAQGAFEHFYGGNFKNRILACEDRILADFDIDIVEKEKEKVYRAVRVGTNWYMAAKKLRFIVDDTKELKIHIKPIERKPDQEIVISLEDFPKRPAKMTKIMVEFDFVSATSCKVIVKDMGFGDYYKATEKTIYKDIKL